jgi:hypothetical protein
MGRMAQLVLTACVLDEFEIRLPAGASNCHRSIGSQPRRRSRKEGVGGGTHTRRSQALLIGEGRPSDHS